MNKNKLSADPLALILGILALVIGIAGCCCYGITAIIPLIMAIIGLVTANKSLREYNENPEVFSPQSRSNVNTAKVINIIAIVMNGIIVVFAIAAIAFYGTMLSSGMLDEIKSGTIEDDDSFDTEIEVDTSSTWEDDTYIIEETNDSLKTDSKKEKSFEDVIKDLDSKY
ncbi:CCC motif membrane protein [Winogradskyella sp.]|uniref:CCC motif membrane protein n=1 Tax=Winogradskyella sp. TaxID=1883156 RepID=UPI0025EA2613|nr:CCC motif membrane protein [Winogradskyella sp.]